MPIDPTLAVRGGEWSISSPATDSQATTGTGQGFGGMLADQVANLEKLQVDAGAASQALATGTATDVSSVVTAVEHARLGMQLASQIRTKAVEAFQDVFHTQV
jgi:flagellar hook-basal body complex protein FliE